MIEYDMSYQRWSSRAVKNTCSGIWLSEVKSHLSYLLSVGIGQVTQPCCAYFLICKIGMMALSTPWGCL